MKTLPSKEMNYWMNRAKKSEAILTEVMERLDREIARREAAEKAMDHDCPVGPHNCAFVAWRKTLPAQDKEAR